MKVYQTGVLKRNEIGRWEIEGREFSSGSCLEIMLGKKWVKGVMEFWHKHSDYFFYTKDEGVPIFLLSGIRARTYNY